MLKLIIIIILARLLKPNKTKQSERFPQIPKFGRLYYCVRFIGTVRNNRISNVKKESIWEMLQIYIYV